MSETGQPSQYLTFFVGGEEYAVPILRVREIIEYSHVTRVPSTPEYIRGVINLRGSVIPAIDLAVKFGLEATAIARTTCIVVVELEGPDRTVMSVIVESVRQVIDLTPADIEPAPSFGVHGRVDFLLGMGVVSESFVLLLDIDKVLSTAEILAAVGTRHREELGEVIGQSLSPAGEAIP